MSERAPAVSLLAPASCPLCLGLFTEPVSIPCGHNFCRGCIERSWRSCPGPFPCPRCRHTAPEPALRPNRELAAVLAVAERLSLRAGPGERRCPRHGQELKLFCEQERSPLCRECRRSPQHRGHPAVPIEEAAQELREKLQAHAQSLRDRREEALALRAAEERKSLDLLARVEAQRRRLRAELRALRELLEQRERLLLLRLARLELRVLRGHQGTLRDLSELAATLGTQIRQLERECERPHLELLQDSSDLLSRLENPNSPEEPPEVPPEPAEEPPKPPLGKLQEMLKEFRAILTLDPDTAHPRLSLSRDGKRVRWEKTRREVPEHPKRFDSSRCVLAREGFGSGRHYWEVRPRSGTAWAVGVARESVPRKGRLRVRPEAGVWAVGRCGSRCRALASPAVPIALPQVLGVYLDYERGRVAFFDAATEEPLFAFGAAEFGGERLLPLLCLGRGCRLALGP